MVKTVCGKQKFFVTAGSNADDDGNDIVADCNRVFVVGNIGGLTATNFNGKPITTLQGDGDAFVSALDNCGHQKFFKTAGGTGNDISNAVSISEKQVFVTGIITGPIANNFAGNPVPNLLPGRNAFVAGLDKKCGDQKFFVTTSSNGDDPMVEQTVAGQLIVNNEKRVFVIGRVDGTEGTKFNGEPITLVGPKNIFLAGLDHCGKQKFYKTLTANIPNLEFPNILPGLNLSCDRIFTSGTFNDTSLIDFNNTTLNLTTTRNIYVAGLDHCGNQKFFKTAGTNGSYFSSSQEIFDECVYLTGFLQGSTATNFANDIITLSGPDNRDIFVAGLDKCGNQKFYVTTNGSTATETSFNISANSSRVFVTGLIDGSANPRNFKGELVKTYGSNDIFVAGLNHKGIQKFYKTAGGINFDTGLLVVSNEDAVYVAGVFSSTATGPVTGADFRGCLIDLDPSNATTFVAKLDNCGNQDFFLTATNLLPKNLFIKDEKVFLTGQLISGTGTDFKGNEIISKGSADIFVTRIDDLCPKPEIFRSKIPFF
jgi:hypothetical protein